MPARKDFPGTHPEEGTATLAGGEISHGLVAEEHLAGLSDDHDELRHGVDDGAELFIFGEGTMMTGEFLCVQASRGCKTGNGRGVWHDGIPLLGMNVCVRLL
jgi:hypothetical protein